MFGLSKLEAMLFAALALFVLIAIGLVKFGYYERHVEHAKDVAADNKAVVVQEKQDAKADTDAVASLTQQNVALAAWIAAHPRAPIIVRRGPACSAQGATVAGGGQAADVPATAGGGVRGSDSIDIGPRVRLIAEVAERAAAAATACEVDVAKRSAPSNP